MLEHSILILYFDRLVEVDTGEGRPDADNLPQVMAVFFFGVGSGVLMPAAYRVQDRIKYIGVLNSQIVRFSADIST